MSGPRDPRSPAEWITLAASCLVLAVLVALIALQPFDQAPPSPVAEVVSHHEVDGFHHVEVAVTNHGEETAANVQVTAELTIDGETTSADQTIDFLAGDESDDLVFVFEDDPADGELTVAVSGFGLP